MRFQSVIHTPLSFHQNQVKQDFEGFVPLMIFFSSIAQGFHSSLSVVPKTEKNFVSL